MSSGPPPKSVLDQQQAAVYLAFFSRGVMKVGITKSPASRIHQLKWEAKFYIGKKFIRSEILCWKLRPEAALLENHLIRLLKSMHETVHPLNEWFRSDNFERSLAACRRLVAAAALLPPLKYSRRPLHMQEEPSASTLRLIEMALLSYSEKDEK